MKHTVLNIIIVLSFLLGSVGALAQVRPITTESFSYQEVAGRIVIRLVVNGVEGDFLLDLKGRSVVLPSFVHKAGLSDITPVTAFDLPLHRRMDAEKKGIAQTVAFGNNVYANSIQFLVVKGETEASLKNLGVDGIVNGSLFRHAVLTIDKRGKRLFTSVPYRPSFIHLTERRECSFVLGAIPEFDLYVEGNKKKVLFDTWQQEMLIWNTTAGFAKRKVKNRAQSISSSDFGAKEIVDQALNIGAISLVNVVIEDNIVPVDSRLHMPSLGLGILDYGVLSIDFDKDRMYFQAYDQTHITEVDAPQLTAVAAGKLNDINKHDFVAYIYDYKQKGTFKLKGDKPVVIDFWASWCGPCMRMMPTMEKLAAKYKDQIVFYKINADLEKELCARYNISVLPTMFYILPGEAPRIEVGDQSEKIEDILQNYLLK